jgi:hypothetical protein
MRRRLMRLHENTVAFLGSLARGLCLFDLSNHELEGLGHIGVVCGAGFGPTALQLLSQLAAVLGTNLALLGSQIALVADNDNWHRLGSLDQRIPN